MPIPALEGEPTTFAAGDTVRWTTEEADYPPSEGWTLHYAIRGAQPLDVEATADVVRYAVAIAAADTAAFPAGTYRWQKFVTNGANERVTLAVGAFLISANLAALEGDQRTYAERMLAAVEARIEGRLTQDVESYTIDGLALTHIPFEQLDGLRARFADQVAAERRAQRGQARQLVRPVRVRFNPPGIV